MIYNCTHRAFLSCDKQGFVQDENEISKPQRQEEVLVDENSRSFLKPVEKDQLDNRDFTFNCTDVFAIKNKNKSMSIVNILILPQKCQKYESKNYRCYRNA